MELDIRRIAVIVAANIIPLVSVLFFGGNIFFLVFLYWAESAVVGFFNILMMATAKSDGAKAKFGKFLMIPFFMVHYGIFMFVHLVFLLFFLTFYEFDIGVYEYFVTYGQLFLINFAVLFLGYLYDFVFDWVPGEERKTATPSSLMARPYPRIIVMQVTIIVGAFLYLSMGTSLVFLLLLIGLKTLAEILMIKPWSSGDALPEKPRVDAG
jgi:hypothetical protein